MVALLYQGTYLSYWTVWSVGEFVIEILSSFFDCPAKKYGEHLWLEGGIHLHYAWLEGGIHSEFLSSIGLSYFTFEAQ